MFTQGSIYEDFIVGDHFIEFFFKNEVKESSREFKFFSNFDGCLVEGGLCVSDKNDVGVRGITFKHGLSKILNIRRVNLQGYKE